MGGEKEEKREREKNATPSMREILLHLAHHVDRGTKSMTFVVLIFYTSLDFYSLDSHCARFSNYAKSFDNILDVSLGIPVDVQRSCV